MFVMDGIIDFVKVGKKFSTARRKIDSLEKNSIYCVDLMKGNLELLLLKIFEEESIMSTKPFYLKIAMDGSDLPNKAKIEFGKKGNCTSEPLWLISHNLEVWKSLLNNPLRFSS